MDPITTTIIAAVLIDLVKTGAQKAFEKGSEQIGENSINWLKSIFFKNEKPKAVVESIILEPQNKDLQNKIDILIENDIENTPSNKIYLEHLLEKYKSSTISNTILHSKNVVTAPIIAGGNVVIGDKIIL